MLGKERGEINDECEIVKKRYKFQEEKLGLRTVFPMDSFPNTAAILCSIVPLDACVSSRKKIDAMFFFVSD